MPLQPITKSGILMMILVITALCSWEYYVRSRGFLISYNEDEALWAKYRAMVYEPSDKTTVFIGSSRIKFDLDIATWEDSTGVKAVQLALAGSNPRLALVNLGADEKFKGKLIIDVTERLFFRRGEDEQIVDRLKYYKEATPAQKVSAEIAEVLESQLVFIDKSHLSLGAMLDQLRIPNRKSIGDNTPFPMKFSYSNFKRQSIMTDEFVSDTNMQKQVQAVWTGSGLKKKHGVTGDTLQKIFNEVKTAVAKIKARGGAVIFIRTPSSGGLYRDLEKINFPRTEYYDKLLSLTGCRGIYFEDYPELKDLICPEWSHLKPADAVIYTKGLIKALQEQGWFTN